LTRLSNAKRENLSKDEFAFPKIHRFPIAQITVPAELPFISFDLSAWHCRQNCDVELDFGLVLFGL
jgi:hypothetical protein